MAPRLRDLLPDPSSLTDLDAAAARLADAVEASETVGIIGDYDVDGTTSCALLAGYLDAVGTAAHIEVPDRATDGYGANPAIVARVRDAGCGVLVTLDNGTTAWSALEAAAEAGLDAIVVDHHIAEGALPPALAVVNPNRPDGSPELGHLAAVGVTFLLVVALNRELRRRGRFASSPEPDLRRWLDLVALGTVCDVVPLTGLNRAFVHQGLRIAARGGHVGLAALASEAGVRGPLSAYHLGFVLGPRINAAGRLASAATALRLLMSDDAGEAAGLAVQLDRLNKERQAIERRTLEAAEAWLADAVERDEPLLVATGEGWHPGVIGIVAGRLVERFHRPVVVISTSDGTGKASGRSIEGFDLGAAVVAARAAGLVREGGGHPMAAGFTVEADRIGELTDFLRDRCTGASAPPKTPKLHIEGSLSVTGMTADLARTLELLAPFGAGNPEPRFCLTEARLVQWRPAGDAHIGCILAGPAGGRARAIAFRSRGTPIGAELERAQGMPLKLAGRVRLDTWRGADEASFQIEDVAPATDSA